MKKKASPATHTQHPTQYIVVRHQGQWKISFDGAHYGPYATQRDAIRAAVDAAHEAGLKGLNGQVLLQDQFRTEWTYGKDPYPPNSSEWPPTLSKMLRSNVDQAVVVLLASPAMTLADFVFVPSL